MELIKDFIAEYGTTILYAVFTTVAGYLGIVVKNIYKKYIDNKIKTDVVNTCVKAVEQLYKDLHGEEKFNKALEAVSEMLAEKGVTITEIEMRMLIEAAVSEFNNAYKSSDNGTKE